MDSDFLKDLKVNTDPEPESPGEGFKRLINDLHQTRIIIHNLEEELVVQKRKKDELEQQIQVFYADFMGLPPVTFSGGNRA